MGVKLGKWDGYLNFSTINGTPSYEEHQIKISKKDLGSGQSAFGIAVFNLNSTGIGEQSEKTLSFVKLPFGALVSDLLEDPIITNDKTSNNMLIN